MMLFPSLLVTSPIATPARGSERGTPASIRARLPPHTLAIDEEPVKKRDFLYLSCFKPKGMLELCKASQKYQKQTRWFCFLICVLRPVKIILLILILRWVNGKVRWGKNGRPARKTTWPPASWTWLVSHLTQDRFEPTVARWWAI